MWERISLKESKTSERKKDKRKRGLKMRRGCVGCVLGYLWNDDDDPKKKNRQIERERESVKTRHEEIMEWQREIGGNLNPNWEYNKCIDLSITRYRAILQYIMICN